VEYGWPGIDGPASTTQTWVLRDPGEYQHNGHNGFNFWNGNSHSGLNGQPLLDTGSTGVRADVCSDAYWNSGSQLWDIGLNGAGDIECLIFGNGWNGIVASQQTAGGTINQATMNSQVAVTTLTNGNTIVGKGVVNASGAVTTDDGNTLQVQGTFSIGSPTVRVSWVASAGPPSGSCNKGSLDSDTTNGNLWFCTSGATWTQVAIP